MADQVQHRPLGGQQALCRRIDDQHHPARIEARTVIDALFQPVAVRAEHLIENQQRNVHPGDHARFAGRHRRRRAGIGGHRRQRGHVGAVAQVFFQSACDHPASFGQLVGAELHQQQAAAYTWLCANAGSVSGKSER